MTHDSKMPEWSRTLLENPVQSEDQPSDPRIPVKDMVTLPHHYARFVIEPIRFIAENNLNFFQGNIVKYVLRHDAKNGLEDILKVIRYAIMFYRFLRRDPDWWKPDPLTPQVKELFG